MKCLSSLGNSFWFVFLGTIFYVDFFPVYSALVLSVVQIDSVIEQIIKNFYFKMTWKNTLLNSKNAVIL